MYTPAELSAFWSARAARWLLHTGTDVAPALRRELVRNLYETIPVFSGGALSTVAVVGLLVIRLPQALFIAWFALELTLMVARLALVSLSRTRVADRREPPSDALVLLELVGAASIGFGAAISIASGDWIAILLAWMSAAALVAEICLRNLGAPRLITGMLLVGALPGIGACLLSGDPTLQTAALLTVVYVYSMRIAAIRLNKMLTTTMHAERENDHRARHDKLTGLLNRAGLEREIELLLQEHHRRDLTLFFVDLDGFKAVNDSQGHAAGDRLLRLIGEQLLQLVGPGDVVARIGGDEFVLVSTLDYLRASEFASAILLVIAETSIDVREGSAGVTASIGIAQSSSYGDDLSTLMSVADTALYAAKDRGGSRFVIAAGERPQASVRSSGSVSPRPHAV